MRYFAAVLTATLAMVMALEPGPRPAIAGAEVFVVNQQFDGGTGVCTVDECTLREAIIAANASPFHDTITFDPAVFPPDDPTDVVPLSPLPEIWGEKGVTIDGTGSGVFIASGHGLVGEPAPHWASVSWK